MQKQCTQKMADKLYHYISFFERRTRKQPYRNISYMCDPAWVEYVEAVEDLLDYYHQAIKALFKNKGIIIECKEHTLRALTELYNTIMELDKHTPNSVFLPKNKKEVNNEQR